ncbi:MAG: hypothetical protein WD993_02350 [Thermoleophilaceae bacterium]
MPAISRPILIALVAAVVAAVAFYATQGGREATDAAAPGAPATTAQSPPADKDSTSPVASRERRKLGKGVPAPVRRAIAARKLVVLFFYERGAADDRATARGVAALRGRRGVAVFSDPIARLAHYRGVIGELGISQAPAVVIVGRDRAARVIEGYIDPATLAQDVADAR